MLRGSGGTTRAKGGDDGQVDQDLDHSRNSHRLIPVQTTTSTGDNQGSNHHFNDCDDVTVITGLATNADFCKKKRQLIWLEGKLMILHYRGV